MFDTDRPTIKDVDKALSKLKEIERPDADNEGEPVNSPQVYDYSSNKDKEIIDKAVEVINKYVRDPNGNPNNRAINLMNKRGYPTSLYNGQYSENGELVGSVTISIDKNDENDEISLNISD